MQQDTIDRLGGPAVVARMLGCKPPSVVGWRKTGVPAARCPAIELAVAANVTAEEMRPDVHWVRVPDESWPHPDGRPCIDVAGAGGVWCRPGVVGSHGAIVQRDPGSVHVTPGGDAP